MSDQAPERPWHRFYGSVPRSIEYPPGSLVESVLANATQVPHAPALVFSGSTLTYGGLAREIERCAAALWGLGLRAGDRILIVMPTSPQGVIAFFAANRIGAVAVMVHPLSTEPEFAHYVTESGARVVLTLDLLFPKFAAVRRATALQTVIVTRIADPLGPLKRLAYRLTLGRKAPHIPSEPQVHWWRPLLAGASGSAPAFAGSANDLAAIFFSGGTTGLPKGIMLTNRNLTAEGLQAASWVDLGVGDVMLAALPIFHGVGLGLCVNSVLLSGGAAILVPRFEATAVAAAVRAGRPTLMVGVPTLFDALARDGPLAGAGLSQLRAAFSGADTLPKPVKERFELMVADRGGSVKLLEGYGLTEAVTAIMAMPLHEYREGSIGIPFPDMDAKICRPESTEELPDGEEGEICIAGPCVMAGYLNDPVATAAALRTHPDGRTWLHTGDLGRRDRDGFFYFSLRLKRMIKSSGFNVYPAQVEEVLYKHPAVAEACVVGIPDVSQGERVVACVVVKKGVGASQDLAEELIALCRKELIKWSCPRDVVFLPELPRTRLNKVDYRACAAEARKRV